MFKNQTNINQQIDLSLLNEYAKKELLDFYQYLIFKFKNKNKSKKTKKLIITTFKLKGQFDNIDIRKKAYE